MYTTYVHTLYQPPMLSVWCSAHTQHVRAHAVPASYVVCVVQCTHTACACTRCTSLLCCLWCCSAHTQHVCTRCTSLLFVCGAAAHTHSMCVHTLYQPPMLSVVLQRTHTACKCYTWSCSGQVNIPADMVQSTPSERTTNSE